MGTNHCPALPVTPSLTLLTGKSDRTNHASWISLSDFRLVYVSEICDPTYRQASFPVFCRHLPGIKPWDTTDDQPTSALVSSNKYFKSSSTILLPRQPYLHLSFCL